VDNINIKAELNIEESSYDGCMFFGSSYDALQVHSAFISSLVTFWCIANKFLYEDLNLF